MKLGDGARCSQRLALLLATLVLAVPLHAQAAAPLSALNAQGTDLPAGAVLFLNRDETPAEFAKDTNVPLAVVQQRGVVRVNQRAFIIAVPPPPAAVLLAQVERFSTAAKAHAFFVLAHTSTANPDLARGTVAPVGAEHFALSGIDKARKPPAPARVIVFRRGPYLVALFLYYPTKHMAMPQLVHIAGAIDSRIRHP